MKNYTITRTEKGELTEKGFTKKIQLREGITEKELLENGFTNHYEPNLYFCCSMMGGSITFNFTVDKESLQIKNIEVLDESFGQPYDYQYYLRKNNENEFARGVFDGVDEILNKLQNDRIITGYTRGMYV